MEDARVEAGLEARCPLEAGWDEGLKKETMRSHKVGGLGGVLRGPFFGGRRLPPPLLLRRPRRLPD